MPTSNHKNAKIWHHILHPSVSRESSRNAFPPWLARYLHPTSAILVFQPRATPDSRSRRFTQHWKSRDHRKHRHLHVSPIVVKPPGVPVSRHAPNVGVGLWHMATRLEYWNVSWWVAQAFTWGSVVWCLNGFFALMPLLYPSTFAETRVSTGWSAWVGATVFELGSVFGIWEAWNRDDVTSFGWSVSQTWHKVEEDLGEAAHRSPEKSEQNMKEMQRQPPAPLSSNPNTRRPESSSGNHDIDAHPVPPSESNNSKRPLPDLEKGVGKDNNKNRGSPSTITSPWSSTTALRQPEINLKRWVWFSTDLQYFREVGFLAAFFQMLGATIFWISGFTALPAIQDSISKRTGMLDGVFWVPQVVGGMGFVISSSFIMLESQKVWYKPAPLSLGWHVGFWNFVGGVGFTACGALGFAAAVNSGVNFQSVLCTFWGSWAFLIGSLLQWYESVNSC